MHRKRISLNPLKLELIILQQEEEVEQEEDMA